MKKYLSYILIIIFLVGLFIPLVRVSASDYSDCIATGATPYECRDMQGDPSYTLLAPLPCDSGPGCINGQLTTFDPTNVGGDKGGDAFSGYLNMMIKLFIGICAVLAVIMIVWGGIEYMTTELISSKEAGKERIRNAIFGLLLALGAWTILNQINPNLLNTSLTSLTMQTVSVEMAADVPQATPPPGGKYADGSVPGATWQSSGKTSASLPSGVTVNHNGVECITVGQKNCTSTKGLDTTIVNSIASGCGSTCNLVITGGTESWLHSAGSSHKPGSSTVDLGTTTDLNNYVTGDGTGKFPKDGSVYQSTKNGICYLAEQAGTTVNTTANHWHVYKASNGKC